MRPIYRTGVPLPSKCCSLYTLFNKYINPHIPAHVAQLSQDWKICFFKGTEWEHNSETCRYQGYVQKASEDVCTYTAVLTANRLFPTPPNASAMMTPENTEPDDHESADKGGIKMELFCD